MLNFTLKIIKYIKTFKYNKNKYIKINIKNIYNYLTIRNIAYINKKITYYGNIESLYKCINFSLLDTIKISKQSWLIKDKNILIIEYYYDYYKYDCNLFIYININNIDDIKIYKYENNYYKSYTNILNCIYVNYINSFLFSVYKNKNENKYIIKRIETNLIYLKEIKKNRFNNKFLKNQEYMFYYKNFKLFKIRELNYNYNYCYKLYYKNYKIYFKLYITDYMYRYFRNLVIRKIKFLLI